MRMCRFKFPTCENAALQYWHRKSFTPKRNIVVLWLIYIDGDGLRYGLRLGFETQWLHCTIPNMFTLHRLGLGSLLPISV